jgi:hypothetical protein
MAPADSKYHQPAMVNVTTNVASNSVDNLKRNCIARLLFVIVRLVKFERESPQPLPYKIIHAQQFGCCSTRRSSTNNRPLLQFEMLIPNVAARIEQPHNLTRHRINRCKVWAFVAIAAIARQRQIRRIVVSCMLLGNNMLDVERRFADALGQSAILAPFACALANQSANASGDH